MLTERKQQARRDFVIFGTVPADCTDKAVLSAAEFFEESSRHAAGKTFAEFTLGICQQRTQNAPCRSWELIKLWKTGIIRRRDRDAPKWHSLHSSTARAAIAHDFRYLLCRQAGPGVIDLILKRLREFAQGQAWNDKLTLVPASELSGNITAPHIRHQRRGYYRERITSFR
jgi:hypothetical protein